MTSSIRRNIRGFVLPKARLFCSPTIWQQGLIELRRRGKGRRESGAFLLGSSSGSRRQVERFLYYDDVDPHCLGSGIVRFSGDAFPAVWSICSAEGLSVVADVHTHPGRGMPQQSHADRTNPMIGLRGHIGLIVPDFASQVVSADKIAIDEYLGEHRWSNHSGKSGKAFFHIGFWGKA